MDDTIHSAEDLERYFGIVPLTTIPESEQFRSKDGEEEDKKRRFANGRKRA
jgi:hypothetical protein